jgi:hypothetical protein
MPDACGDFLAEFDRLKIKLPLKLSLYDIGDIIDSDGRHVCICDLNCERPNQDAVAIAVCFVRAVNTCAGYTTGTVPTPDTIPPSRTPDMAT